MSDIYDELINKITDFTLKYEENMVIEAALKKAASLDKTG